MSTFLIILAILVLLIYLSVATFAASALTRSRRRGVVTLDGKWTYQVTPRSELGLDYHDVTFCARGDGTQISGWYVPCSPNERAIIVVHGRDKSRTAEFQGNALRLLGALHKRDFALLVIDMRGHGSSAAGPVTFGMHERRDILGAVDWLIAQGFERGRIGVLGASMGAAASIGAAAEEPAIGALVVDSAYAAISSVMRDIVRRHARALHLVLPTTLFLTRYFAGINIGAARPVDEIKRIAPRPLLIIHGTHDWLIPASHAQDLHAAAPGSELWLVSGAGHVRVYAAEPQRYVERIATFFSQGLR